MYSSVATYDFAGTVISVGPNSPFKPDDKVFGVNPAGPNRPLYLRAHQDFAIADSGTFNLMPLLRISVHEAAGLPVVTLSLDRHNAPLTKLVILTLSNTCINLMIFINEPADW